MSTVWIVSMILQWVVIALLAVAVLRLLRAHGEGLATTRRPVQAGLKVAARELAVAWPAGTTVLLGARGRTQLVVFYSTSCGPCRSTQEAVEEAYGDLAADLLVVIADQLDVATGYARTGVLGDVPVVALEDFPEELYPGSTPSAIVIANGRITRTGRPESAAELHELAATTRGAAV